MARREPGDRLFFEYHCNEADDSSDALLWYHTCQYCTVLRRLNTSPEQDDWDYLVRFDDGVKWIVYSDELMTAPPRTSTWSRTREAGHKGCRPARSRYDVRLELRCADLISGKAEYKETLLRQERLGEFLTNHPEYEIRVELIPEFSLSSAVQHQDAYLFFNAGKIPQVAILLAKLDRPVWRKKRLLYGDILDVPKAFPQELAELITEWYGWRIKRGAV